METIDKRSNNTILAHSGNRTWSTAMKNKKLLLGNIHDKPISGLYRVTEIVLKFPPPPFGLHNQKVAWVSLLYLLTKVNADYLSINRHWLLSLSLDSDYQTTRLRYQGLWAPNNYRQPLRSHHDPVPGSHCTLVQSTLPVTITVPSYWYYRYTYQPHARHLYYQSCATHHLIQLSKHIVHT